MAASSVATLHRTMLAASSGIRRARSTSSPTGSTATAPTSSATELSRPIFVLPMCSERSSCGATAPTVAICALESASTQANSTITRARAGPPTSSTTCPWSRRPNQRTARISARAARSGRPRSSMSRRPTNRGALAASEDNRYVDAGGAAEATPAPVSREPS